MKQKILRNFIDEQMVSTLLGPVLNVNYGELTSILAPRWVYFDRPADNTWSPGLTQSAEYISTKLAELEKISANVEKIRRGITFTPPTFYPIFDGVDDNTSYVLFISTGTFEYQRLPLIYPFVMEELPEEFIILPITLSAGDALLIQYDSTVHSTQGIISSEMTHCCTVYLQPKELWP
jgi:hypothetical protein